MFAVVDIFWVVYTNICDSMWSNGWSLWHILFQVI